MARPQTAYTAKPSKERRTGLEKMQMSHDRMRKDIKRIQMESAKNADLAESKPKRR